MEDIQDAANALRALANDSTKVTKKTARLRQLLPEIEALQAAGVSHEHILEALNKSGFDLKMSAYSSMLWRIRHGKSKAAPKIAPVGPSVDAETIVPIGEGSTPEPEANDQQETVSEIVETRKRREERADRFIGSDSNSLIKNLKGIRK